MSPLAYYFVEKVKRSIQSITTGLLDYGVLLNTLSLLGVFVFHLLGREHVGCLV